MKDKYINKMVWTAPSPNSIIYGKVVDFETRNGWSYCKVSWSKPHEGYEISDWVRIDNVSLKLDNQLLRFFFNECR